MSKRIEHISELPDWFSLKKYEPAKNMSSAQWYEQLSVRKGLQTYVKMWEVAPDFFVEALNHIRANVIVHTSDNETLATLFGGGALTDLNSELPSNYTRGVRASTMRDLYRHESSLYESKRDYGRAWWNQILTILEKNDDGQPAKQRLNYEAWIDHPIFHNQDSASASVLTSINLNVPDRILIEEFPKYLSQIRKETGKDFYGERYRKPNFNEWVRFGLLPYLDLRIWEMETDSNIPNRVMADAIFPPGEGGEEVVRKTTEKMAEELLSEKHLTTLLAIAASEHLTLPKG